MCELFGEGISSVLSVWTLIDVCQYDDVTAAAAVADGGRSTVVVVDWWL